MGEVIFIIIGIILLLMIALLAAYLNLRSIVEIMKDTIKLRNKRYNACLKGWERAIQSIEEVISLNDQLIEINKQLCSELYDNKEDDNNECE